ncbi:hypothetical protein C8J57DRAFT_1348104 [Mycena rebaudengoi]|nr:hypothetical protein C8J57DRAFT_1348104 [Mycena rebaudengoi]
MLSSNILPLPLLLLCSVPILASTTPTKLILNSDSRYQLALPGFDCTHYAVCGDDGRCACPAGWGGDDCLVPQCDSLADGDNRRLREEGTSCDCKEGWGGVNCNVCQTDRACADFPFAESDAEDMVCYTGGELVFSNYRMCKVTNRLIVETVNEPQVTFSCDGPDATCAFQFWVAEVEAFYCALDQCTATTTVGVNLTTTTTHACIPGRNICGKSGEIDLTEFFQEEVKGPASFSCKTGGGCKFEEPAMNELISDLFGDDSMTMDCDVGECLRRSQVPGLLRY